MTASILPNAKNQFIDGNGAPLAGGKVWFYIPSTETLKNTWQDAAQMILNTNPITLDASGEALIYGNGQYRQVVYDKDGNLIWDQLTTSAGGGVLPSPGPDGNVLTASNGNWISKTPINIGTPPVGLLWPAYIYPPSTYYATMITLMGTYPNVPLVTILNVDSGPGIAVDPNYTLVISQLEAAGATVIGYVHTSYATRPIADVKADILAWVTFYPKIEGIFVDEMDNTAGSVSYYVTVKSYINSLGLTLVIDNAGTSVAPEDFTNPTADTICIYENIDVWPTSAQASNNGLGSKAQRCAIVTQVTFDPAQFAIMTQYCKYVWATDFVNNYGQIPTYIATLFSTLAGINTAQSAAVAGFIVPVDNGGTGLVNLPATGLLVGNNTNPVSVLLPSTSGNVLTSAFGTWQSEPLLGIGTNNPVGLLWPAYIYPSGGGLAYYSTMETAIPLYPDVPVVVVLNVSSGPGSSPDANYTAIIASLQAAGATVIGYVYTDYSARAIADVKADCAEWQSLYPTIQGIFVDQMDKNAVNVSYYVTLNSYIKGLGLNLVIGNVGTTADAIYFSDDTADSIVIFATDGHWPTVAQASNNGLGTKSQRSAIVTSEAYSSSDFAIMTQYCKYVWATDYTNNFAQLPTYLTTLFQALEANNLIPSIEMPGLSVAGNPSSLTGNMKPIIAETDGYVLTRVGTQLEFAAPTGGGGPVKLNTTSVSNAGYIEFLTGIDSTYPSYQIRGRGVFSASANDQLFMLVYQGGGLITSAHYDIWGSSYTAGSNTVTSLATIFAASNAALSGSNIQNSVAKATSLILDFFQPSVADPMTFLFRTSTAGPSAGSQGGGDVNTSAATTGIRIYCPGGNITGTFELWGYP